MTGQFKKTLAGSLLAVLVFGCMVLAQPNINQRQRRNQQQRIGKGVQSGQLTPHETVRLEKDQQRIARNEAAAKSDGNFTPQERAKIQRELNHSSRDIYRQKHDNQVQH
jgi:uncharacterized membrane protein YebE (DUF533 family)